MTTTNRDAADPRAERLTRYRNKLKITNTARDLGVKAFDESRYVVGGMANPDHLQQSIDALAAFLTVNPCSRMDLPTATQVMGLNDLLRGFPNVKSILDHRERAVLTDVSGPGNGFVLAHPYPGPNAQETGAINIGRPKRWRSPCIVQVLPARYSWYLPGRSLLAVAAPEHVFDRLCLDYMD